MNIGILGCGNIVDQYLQSLTKLDLGPAAVSDIDASRAESKASEYGVPRVLSPDALFDDDGVELIINLTPPALHTALNLRAIESGKHVYSEKSLAVTLDEAKRQVEAAEAKGVTLGCAPDTFLGAGLQTCRRLYDEGAVGTPAFAIGTMIYGGPDNWHPDPLFFFRAGAGPLMDMGPYYITALVNLLGPVRSVVGSTRSTLAERTVKTGGKAGERFRVETPSHVSCQLEFECGAIASLIMSFDGFAGGGERLPRIVLFGTEGTLDMPDPNTFGGPISLQRRGGEAETIEAAPSTTVEAFRGLGVLDQIRAVREGRPLRASGRLACHVVDVMTSALRAGERGERVMMATTAERPEPWPDPLAALASA